MKLFVTSDVHSFYTELQEALNKSGFDINNPEHHLIICGDLFDRGPDSVKVYEFVKNLSKQDRVQYIRGNHEDLIFDCMEEVRKHEWISSHHISNGTVDTISQFTGINKYDLCNGVFNDNDLAKMDEVLNFITYNTINYVQIGDYVLVHSWIPLICKSKGFYHKNYSYNPSWKCATEREWENARWGNPFEMAERELLSDEHIIFGHFHTSYAWHKYKGKSEFGDGADFSIYYGDGFTGIDACTAYSKRVNVLIIEDGKMYEVNGVTE